MRIDVPSPPRFLVDVFSFVVHAEFEVGVLLRGQSANRLKRVEKFHCLKPKLMFAEDSQTEWREPFDFPTEISGFSM